MKFIKMSTLISLVFYATAQRFMRLPSCYICHCKHLTTEKHVRWLLVDFEKAFDRVNHALGLQKLMTLGVSHYLVKEMHYFLFQRRLGVNFSCHLSNWITLRGSMTQGSPLGPLCYNVSII